MKALKNNLSIILGALLIATKGYMVFRLNFLPQEILTMVDVTEHTQVVRARIVANPLYYWLALDFILVIALAYSIVSQKLTLSIQESGVSADDLEAEADVDGAQNEPQGGITEKLTRLQTTMTHLLYEQKEKTVGKKLELLLSTICALVEASAGIIYSPIEKEGIKYIEFSAGFAVYQPESNRKTFEFGEGLPGQVAKSQKSITVNEVPEGYISLISGLGDAKPGSLMLLACTHSGQLKAVLEVAAFHHFSNDDKEVLEAASKEVVRLLQSHEQAV